MEYYEIYVASARYQKQEPLTYQSELNLTPGDVAIVPLGKQEVLGFIHAKVTKPKFVCKPIVRVISGIVLPQELTKLFAWIQTYYLSGSGAITQLFLPSSLNKKNPVTLEINEANKRSDIQDLKQLPLPELRPAQAAAIKQIKSSKTHHFLLHGETGSGKTRIYIERSLEALKAGKSALILTPEIGLTPQLAQTFSATFGNKVIIMHSNLTAKNRRELWLRIARPGLANEPVIVIGPRSALFSPINNLGLIVVDEFHEPAYKQEQAPRYQAVRVAAMLAKLHNAEIIYGSATPPVAEYYLAEQTGMPIIQMDSPKLSEANQVKTDIINLSDKSNFTRHPFIADTLLKAIEHSLHKKEQVLIYLNRRGTARLVLCQSCGWQALCPRCDLPLTYHGDGHHLRCHTCGWQQSAPLQCPTCASTDLQYRTMGTKALVEAMQGFFPSANIMRFDTDLAVADRIDKHYADIQSGKVDILVGTQMLGKGLDLPKLGLVGVVAADTSLYMPDFTAAERTYQLLHQVLGRVGRGHGAARVIIQSYAPDNPVLQAATRKDFIAFYDAEMLERKTFMFPPFCYLLKISTSRKSSASAEKAITSLHHTLETTKLKINLSDPAHSFYEHTHGMYHWQLVLKSKDRKELLSALKALPPGNYTYDLDPANLL